MSATQVEVLRDPAPRRQANIGTPLVDSPKSSVHRREFEGIGIEVPEPFDVVPMPFVHRVRNYSEELSESRYSAAVFWGTRSGSFETDCQAQRGDTFIGALDLNIVDPGITKVILIGEPITAAEKLV
jgi:hypothetical protein